MPVNIENLKRTQMEHAASVRRGLWTAPDLCWLFFELTTRCNLHCQHCGSRCEHQGIDLESDMVLKALDGVDPKRVMIAVTGGEPLLHPYFYEIMHAVSDRGYHWGMTSNATLIDHAAAMQLKAAGMRTISVSLDGLEESHDRLRGRKGAWRDALNGTRALIQAGFAPQITTVVHPGNLSELPQMETLLRQEGINSWRIINVEPLGRAKDRGHLMLNPREFRQMLDFIRDRRFHSEMDVSFGCSHFLGVDMERMVRDQYFFCGAGITIASIRANGDICACLDIENRPELVQGNIHEDSFMDVWTQKYQYFRQDRTGRSNKCRACPDNIICGGDSTHTWDFDREEPMLCVRDLIKRDP